MPEFQGTGTTDSASIAMSGSPQGLGYDEAATNKVGATADNIIRVENCTDLDPADAVVTSSMVSFTCLFDDTVANTLNVTIDIAENPGFGTADAAVLSATSFSVQADAEYSVIGGTSGSRTVTLDAGEWTLNGSSVLIPYMPFNDSISQILLVTNDGSSDGAGSIEAYDEEGHEYGPFNAGESEGRTTKNITAAVRAGLAAEGFELGGATKRLAIRITTNVPDGDVTVYSAYNVGGTGARLVVNDSNGKAED